MLHMSYNLFIWSAKIFDNIEYKQFGNSNFNRFLTFRYFLLMNKIFKFFNRKSLFLKHFKQIV